MPTEHRIRWEDVRSGAVMALYGFFMKLVLAERAATIANTVFGRYQTFGTSGLALGMVAFALQIYFDFASYSYIAIGVARMLGLRLNDNFNAPYFATSVQDFWRRWHISLSTWFRDYLYIPMGGGRVSKPRKYLNIMATFLVSGLWHGANWTFVVWGALNGAYQVLGGIVHNGKQALYERFHIKRDCDSFRIGSTVCTFFLICLTWVFFRAPDIGSALEYIGRMFTQWDLWKLLNGQALQLGLSEMELVILLFGTAVVWFFDAKKHASGLNIDLYLDEQNLLFQMLAAAALLLAIIVFGNYGPSFNASSFIYSNF